LLVALVGCLLAIFLVAPGAADATMIITTAPDHSAQEGSVLTGVLATFTTDTPTDSYSAIIDWGDATTTAGTVSQSGANLGVSGTHTYADDGSYVLTVTVTETGASPGTATATENAVITEGGITVSSAVPTLTEGTAFSGAVATFKDPGSPDPAGYFTATIDWGDGTQTAGTVTSPSAGNFSVSGSHTYADEVNAIAVTVSDPGVNFTTGAVTIPVTVNDADLVSGTPTTFAATNAIAFNGIVATFSDSYPGSFAAGLVATISWGDGTTTAGTVSGSAGSYSVSGSHTYNAPPAQYAVTATLSDAPPGTAMAQTISAATVSANQPSVITQAASNVAPTGATLHGTINANGAVTSYHYEYGRSIAYGSTTPTTTSGSLDSADPAPASLSGLTPATTYHYRIVASNAKGTTDGTDLAFTTAAATVAPPKLTGASLARRAFPATHGTTLKLSLSEPAVVTVVITQRVHGRRVHGRCRAHARSGKRCPLTVTRRTIRLTGVAGPNNFRFRPVGLRRGRYTATLTARGPTNQSSRPTTLAFTLT
jgi:hypothetical protein